MAETDLPAFRRREPSLRIEIILNWILYKIAAKILMMEDLDVLMSPRRPRFHISPEEGNYG